ncbi:MAG: pyridoxamine 5'-phosphate oxidase family protein [Phocaeicola sp.]
MKILSEKFFETIAHEGVVSIVSWGATDEPHVVNTWNSYLMVTEDERILIPAYGMRKTEKNIEANNRVKLTLGSRDVKGYKDYQGTGFLIEATAQYLDSGTDFDRMKEAFSFTRRVVELTIVSIKQML